MAKSTSMPNLSNAYSLIHNHPAISLFEELLQAPSVSGHEGKVATLVRARLSMMGYDAETDAAGNVLVRLPGLDDDAPLVCYAAHMDEIGMVVTSVEPDGSLKVARSGGLYPWKLGEGPVDVLGDRLPITGILSMGSTHRPDAADMTVTWDDVSVITGLTPEQLADAGIRAGTPAAPSRVACGPVVFGDPGDPLVAAWTFDDRMGCVALLRLLEAIKEEEKAPRCPTIVAFVVGEEVGGLGAKSLAFRERPQVFVSVDGSPTPAEAPLTLDGRPAIWAKDRLVVYDQPLLRTFLQTAGGLGIDVQTAAYTQAASDASLLHYAGLAPRVACFGHVRENSHGYEIARLSVFDNVLKVLVEFAASYSGS